MSNEWILHTGTKCPVSSGTVVEVEFRDGGVHTHNAEVWNWKQRNRTDDIIAYRVIIESTDATVEVKQKDKHIQALRDMLKQRSAVGIKKYGATLERTDCKPSEWAQHMLEELLDAAGYLHRLKEELELIESNNQHKENQNV